VGFQPAGIVALFHPGGINGATISGSTSEVPLTDEGAATVRQLRLNLHGRVTERRVLIECGLYPQEAVY